MKVLIHTTKDLVEYVPLFLVCATCSAVLVQEGTNIYHTLIAIDMNIIKLTGKLPFFASCANFMIIRPIFTFLHSRCVWLQLVTLQPSSFKFQCIALKHTHSAKRKEDHYFIEYFYRLYRALLSFLISKLGNIHEHTSHAPTTDLCLVILFSILANI